jgi:hypothetical protein
MIAGDGWFEGSIISVLAQACQEELGSRARAYHISPLILHFIGQFQAAGESWNNEFDEKWVWKEIHRVRFSYNNTTLPALISWQIGGEVDKEWLIPAHGSLHWALVVLNWKRRTAQFLDSLPRRSGASEDETVIRHKVWCLVQLVAGDTGLADISKWQWKSEPVCYLCGCVNFCTLSTLGFTEKDPSDEWKGLWKFCSW